MHEAVNARLIMADSFPYFGGESWLTSKSDNAQASKASGSASSIGPLRTTISALTSKSLMVLGSAEINGAPLKGLHRVHSADPFVLYRQTGRKYFIRKLKRCPSGSRAGTGTAVSPCPCSSFKVNQLPPCSTVCRAARYARYFSISPRLVNVCPVTASLKVLGPDAFAVKTPGPAGGTMGGCGTSCAAARATLPTMPSTTQSFIWRYASSSVYGVLTCNDSLPQT